MKAVPEWALAQMAEFRCRECTSRSLGLARVAIWPGHPILDVRNDPDVEFVSAKDRYHRRVMVPDGVTFDPPLREGLKRMLVKQTGRATWDRVKRHGVWYLEWKGGCGCGRSGFAFAEEQVRAKVEAVRPSVIDRRDDDGHFHPVPVPI